MEADVRGMRVRGKKKRAAPGLPKDSFYIATSGFFLSSFHFVLLASSNDSSGKGKKRFLLINVGIVIIIIII